MSEAFDVAVVGAGMSGMTAALLLAAEGYRVVVLEAHTTAGGCAGYFRRKDFSFDVGATTFISFQPGGIGWELQRRIGLTLPLERIKTYTLCLPDRQVPISSRDWTRSWAASFPELPRAEEFFERLGHRADKVWDLACGIPSLPWTGLSDLTRSLTALKWKHLPVWSTFVRTLAQEIGQDQLPFALRGAFNMLLQDTTQNDLDDTPAAYGLLGLTLMRHGLYRPVGSTATLWTSLVQRLGDLGGEVRFKTQLTGVERAGQKYRLHFKRQRRQPITADWLISAIPVWNTYELAPELFQGKLEPYLDRREDLDGAFALFLGVRDLDLPSDCLHFQVLSSYHRPLSEGNNFLISLSAPDEGAAPEGARSVTISCHTEPTKWEGADEERKRALGSGIVEQMLSATESLFPGFRQAVAPEMFFPASPLTYRRFTRRYRGMAGNQPLRKGNSLFRAVPRRYGNARFVQIGDTGFPGAGTVACMLSGFNAYGDVVGSHPLKG